MKKFIIFAAFTLLSCFMHAQVGIGNTNPKSSLDISASSITTPSSTDGLLIPRIDDFPSPDPGADQDGMLVFATGNGTPSKGFYYWDQGTMNWIAVSNGSGIQKLDDLSDGKSDSDGTNNGSSIFLGINAGFNDDSNNNQNVGIGFGSLKNNISAGNNTAVGSNSMTSTTSGDGNTAVGSEALKNNTTGYHNVALGYEAALSNTTGIQNLAVGMQALRSNTTSSFHLAIGKEALYFLNGGSGNLALGYRSLYNTTFANDNVGVGLQSLFSNTTGSSNVGLGSNVLYNNMTGSQNVALGRDAGFNYSGSRSVFVGYQAGYDESNGNRLYIENSNADATNALIYGEFDNDILRTNGTFQIGVPSGTGYAFPTIDGSSGQVMTTNGAGQLSFASQGNEWSDGGSYIYPVDGNTKEVLIGTTSTGNGKLQVNGDGKDAAIETDINGTNNYGIYNLRDSGGAALKYGLYNDIGGNNFSFGAWGTYNRVTASGDGSRIGTYNIINSTGTGNKIAMWNYIPAADPGTHYGVYSDVQKGSGYAGYFIGRTSLGNTVANRYLMPAADGSTGQVMTTDGSGNVSFQAVPMDGTGTDDQTIDNFSLSGSTLGISLENDGQAPQTVDLSNINFNVSNFALAKMSMSVAQVHPVSSWTKQNFDTAVFDIGTNFDTAMDRFNVTEAGHYRVNASYRSSTNIVTNDLFGISVYVNGSAVKTYILNHYASGPVIRNVNTIIPLAVGDYVEIYFFANGALTVSNSTVYTEFYVERIR
jgi:hypothetical protein